MRIGEIWSEKKNFGLEDFGLWKDFGLWTVKTWGEMVDGYRKFP